MNLLGCESCGPEEKDMLVARPPYLDGLDQVSALDAFIACRDYLLRGSFDPLEHAAMEQYFKQNETIHALASRCVNAIVRNECPLNYYMHTDEGKSVAIRREDAIAQNIVAAKLFEIVETGNYL